MIYILMYVETSEPTLPKNDLLCHLNWEAQVLMKISSNV